MKLLKQITFLLSFLLLSISCTFVNDIADDAVDFSQDENSGDNNGGDEGPFTVTLAASGIDSELVTLSVQGQAFEIAADGDYAIVEDVPSGTELTVTITYDGDDWACELSNVPATVTEDTTANLDCAEQLWLQDAYIKAVNVTPSMNFGLRVAIDGDFIVVASDIETGTVPGINNTDNHNEASSGPATGAVYILTKGSDGHWYQDAYAKPTNLATTTHLYGASVAIEGDYVAVGDRNEASLTNAIINTDNTAAGSTGGAMNGAVYILKRDSTTGDWVQDAYLNASDNADNYEFGSAVAVGEDRVAVGASGHDVNGGFSGAVYIFERDSSNGDWTQTALIQPSNSHANQLFGGAVAFEGDTLVVGAPGDENNATETGVYNSGEPVNITGSSNGGVYVYKHDGSNWNFDAFLRPQNPLDSSNIGASVAIDNGIIVVGAPGFADAGSGIDNTDSTDANDNSVPFAGAVFVYRENSDGDWFQDAYINPSNGGDVDLFGSSVDISNGTIVVGSEDEESNQTGITNENGTADGGNVFSDVGAAYVFSVDLGGDWFQDAFLKNAGAAFGQSLGQSVAIDGDFIVAGVPEEDANAVTINDDDQSSTDSASSESGAALVFEDRYTLDN